MENVIPRLAAYVGLLVLIAATAAGVGLAVGPLDETSAAGDNGAGSMGHDAEGEQDGAAAPDASGLAVARDGYELDLAETTLAAGREKRLSFRILDAEGEPVREFDLEGGVRMHLIVVRRDLTGYQHLHPRLEGDGTFTTELELPTGGVWRAFADFERGGKKTVLGADLTVAGAFAPEPLPAPATQASTAGYEVELAAEPRAGRDDELVFHVRRGGHAIALEPYLGARGHLVALRQGDLAYLHVHPGADDPVGEVSFEATFPTAGSYRLFFQFKDEGRVQTVAYTQEVSR